MTKSILVTILLTAVLPACSIEPLSGVVGSRSKSDPTTGETDEQPDQNEPNNGKPNTEPKLTYISCREVRACSGLADCFDVFSSLCGAPITGGFYCGDERATLHVRGSLECGEAVVAALDCCADIDAAYERAE
jgi:hypothetical protein